MKTNSILAIPGTSVRLGDRARDVVGGFEGIVTQHCRYLTGCDRIGLEGDTITTPEGKVVVPYHWIDVASVELVKMDVVGARPMPKDVPASG